jgi:hypothetical protein
LTSILQVLAKVMKVFGILIAHINEPILRNLEHSQFFELLTQALKYSILIPFFMLSYLVDLSAMPLHYTMSTRVIK